MISPRAHRPAGALGSKPVPAGVVEVQPHGDGWYLVAIGRAKHTKRFNITRGEAAELVRVLQQHIPEAKGGLR